MLVYMSLVFFVFFLFAWLLEQEAEGVQIRSWGNKQIVTEDMMKASSVAKTLFVLQPHINPYGWPVEHGVCLLRLEDALVTVIRQVGA
jgi:hypothetical protein